MLHLLIVPATLSAISVVDTSNAFEGGNELYGQCTSKGAEMLVCVGYIKGVSDMMEIDRVLAHKEPCMPASANGQQAIDLRRGL